MYSLLNLQENLYKEVGSQAEDGALDVHSCGELHPNIRLYCMVALSKNSNRTKLYKIQRSACAGAT